MATLRDFLLHRRDELTALILPIRKEIAEREVALASLEAELAEIEKSEAAIGMVNGVQTPVNRESAVRKGTIKDYAVQVLSEHPGGLVALDILTKINERFGTEYSRTSLSPQLSRLNQDGIVNRRGLVWYLVDQKSKGPDLLSGPFDGDVAERSIASDSKSEEPSSSKNSAGSVGSNPTISAPFNRTKVDLLSGVSHFGAPTPNFQSGKKGG